MPRFENMPDEKRTKNSYSAHFSTLFVSENSATPFSVRNTAFSITEKRSQFETAPIAPAVNIREILPLLRARR